MRRAAVCMLLLAAAASSCGGKVVLDAPGAGGGTSSSSNGSSSGAGAGQLCQGSGCGPDAYCGWANEECGGNDAPGICTPRPTGCDKNLDLTCGCDGKTYDNDCEAQLQGVDVDVLGGCMPPAGLFGCGAHFCALGTFFCVETPGSPVLSATCMQPPPQCAGALTCECLASAGAACDGDCVETADKGILMLCSSG